METTSRITYRIVTGIITTTLAFIAIMIALVSPAAAQNPEEECADFGLVYVDKIDDIADSGTYISDMGFTYLVTIIDNPNPTPDSYTLVPDPGGSGYYPGFTNITQCPKCGVGGGLSHVTICGDPYQIETSTPLPTDTPVPTNTPLPTDTPVPTDTPTPTDTAVPTETPTPVVTETPTDAPTVTPTDAPTTPIETPTTPAETPTGVPTEASTEQPTIVPTEVGTSVPTMTPTSGAVVVLPNTGTGTNAHDGWVTWIVLVSIAGTLVTSSVMVARGVRADDR